MRLYEILVPTVKNTGRPYKTRHHREWDRQVRRVTGGLTILTPAKGQWVSPSGDLFLERMIPVRILADVWQIRQVIDLTFKHYPDQEAVFCVKISDDAVIHYRKK